MDTFHPLQSKESIVDITILHTTMGYLAYRYISFSPKISKRRSTPSGMFVGTAKKILFQRLIGILFLGLVPAFITLKFLPFSTQNLGVSFSCNFDTLIWIISLSGIAVLLSYFSIKSHLNYRFL